MQPYVWNLRQGQLLELVRRQLARRDRLCSHPLVLPALLHELAQEEPRARAPLLLVHDVVVAVWDEPDDAQQPRLLDREHVLCVRAHVRLFRHLGEVREPPADDGHRVVEVVRLGGNFAVETHLGGCTQRVLVSQVGYSYDLQEIRMSVIRRRTVASLITCIRLALFPMRLVSDPRVRGERKGHTHRQEGPEIVTDVSQQGARQKNTGKRIPAEYHRDNTCGDVGQCVTTRTTGDLPAAAQLSARCCICSSICLPSSSLLKK